MLPVVAGSQEGSAKKQMGTPSATNNMAKKGILANSISMKFIAIPAGCFLMGAGNNVADASDSEKPQHQVTISQKIMATFISKIIESSEKYSRENLGINPPNS